MRTCLTNLFFLCRNSASSKPSTSLNTSNAGLRNSGVVFDIDSSDEDIITNNKNSTNTSNFHTDDSKLSEDFETEPEVLNPPVKKEKACVGSSNTDALTRKTLKDEKASVGNLETSGTFWGDWDNDGANNGS